MYYYCTCDPKRRSQTKLGRTPYRRTKVNSDEVCIDCGYYAIACRENLDPEKGLRAYLMDEGQEEKPEIFKGGLSLKAQKVKRKRDEAKRKSEDGNLDV